MHPIYIFYTYIFIVMIMGGYVMYLFSTTPPHVFDFVRKELELSEEEWAKMMQIYLPLMIVFWPISIILFFIGTAMGKGDDK